MTRKAWYTTAVLAIGCVLAAAALANAAEKTKDKIPVNPKLGVKPLKGAIVLFSGKPEEIRDNWYARRSTDPGGWTVDDKGVATPNKCDICTRQEFGDCYVHVEFREPLTGNGNSGVGMEGRYEVQILNSYGKKEPGIHDCGAYYDRIPPKVNACKPAGKWQTMDIFFRAPVSTRTASSWRRPAPPFTRTRP